MSPEPRSNKKIANSSRIRRVNFELAYDTLILVFDRGPTLCVKARDEKSRFRQATVPASRNFAISSASIPSPPRISSVWSPGIGAGSGVALAVPE